MSDALHNPWRVSLENCISGDNYLRASEYRELIEELDDLYRLRAQVAALSAPAPAPAEAVNECLDTDSPWLICKPCAKVGRCAMHAAPAAPAGWQWVPVEPTLAMLDALRADTTMYLPARYAAMLAAAPGAQGDAS